MLAVSCPSCGASTEVPDESLGKRGRCICGHVFTLKNSLASMGQGTVFKPAEKKRRSPSRFWTAFLGMLTAVLVVLVVLIAQSWIPSPTNTKAALFATTEKFDGKDADKLKFWIDYRDAGHGSWAELDELIEGHKIFGSRLTLSAETKAAYKKWRDVRSAVSQKKSETVAQAKARAVKAIKLWDSKSPYAADWINDIANGKSFDAGMAATLDRIGFEPETIAAMTVWSDATRRLQKE